MLELRDYQNEMILSALAAIGQKEQKALLVSPTGSGKTEVMIGLIKKCLDIKEDMRFCVLLNRVQLVEQTEKRFIEHFNSVGVVCSTLRKKDVSKQITVMAVGSSSHIPNKTDVLLIDEAHNLPLDNPSSRYFRAIDKIANQNESFKVVGFTATPFRATGLIYGKGRFFPYLTRKVELSRMINEGFLVKPLLKHTLCQHNTDNLTVRGGDFLIEEIAALVNNKAKNIQQIKDALPKLFGRKKIFWMCATIEQCNNTRDTLLELGEEAVGVTSDINHADRSSELKEFEHGQARHCTFVSILSEGYNYPPADALVILRPIKSPVLYVQTVGRILRPFEDKADALVLDYGEVVKNCGPLDSPIINTGKRLTKKEKLLQKSLMKFCKSCLTYQPRENIDCISCGRPFTEESKSKLTATNFVGDILSGKINESTERELGSIFKITAELYRSKQNNECVKITYKSMLNDAVEYFPVNKEWGIAKIKSRAYTLGLPLKYDWDEIYLAANLPNRVTYTYEKGHKRITGIYFGERNRASDS
jgi:superfamily II DNA or RNA helicase